MILCQLFVTYLLLNGRVATASPSSALMRAGEQVIPEGGWLDQGAQPRLVIEERNSSGIITPSLFMHRVNSSDNSSASASEDDNCTSRLTWGGTAASNEELAKIRTIRHKITLLPESPNMSSWVHHCEDTEVLRFLRKNEGRVEDAVKQLAAHAVWRLSPFGAETVVDSEEYSRSNVHKEIFWLGTTVDGCPALVIRTQAHDGADYQEDPKVFMAVLVQILEQGRRLYGVGLRQQVCLILDRGPVATKSGKRRNERDMSVLPSLVKLFTHVYSTVMNHYPELLFQAKIVPSSWFFSMCFKMTSVMMDPTSRAKFQMVGSDEVSREMTRLFGKEILPIHLGGSALTYGNNPSS